jgi:hypothetical protein
VMEAETLPPPPTPTRVLSGGRISSSRSGCHQLEEAVARRGPSPLGTRGSRTRGPAPTRGRGRSRTLPPRPLVEGEECRAFRCPYHSWVRLDGALRGSPGCSGGGVSPATARQIIGSDVERVLFVGLEAAGPKSATSPA